ncbi:hypothetical protein [Caulobacter sp. LARHSG274]
MNIIGKAVLAATVGAAAFAATPSQAYDWGLAVKIASVEATYMPNVVAFTADRAVGTCAAGHQLLYIPTGDTADLKAHNANAVFSMLISARLAQQWVVITGNNANCTVLFVNMQ